MAKCNGLDLPKVATPLLEWLKSYLHCKLYLNHSVIRDCSNEGCNEFNEISPANEDDDKLKGQLQRFHKLSLFDRFRHVENGFDINFENSFPFSCYKLSKF